jgi:hypothetical protein
MADDSAITIHRTSPIGMQERELYVWVDGAPNVIPKRNAHRVRPVCYDARTT